MSNGKKIVDASPAVSAVIAEIERQRGRTRRAPDGPNMAPVMAPRPRKPLPQHLREPDPVINPDTPIDELPTVDEIINPDTGIPARNIRYRSPRGNVIQRQ